MSEFALLHGSILNSSVWVLGSKEERLVWITILAMKDREGVVKSSMVGLADRAKVEYEECEAAVKKFLEPDEFDTSKVDEGRRLRVIPGGWQVVNHEYYQFSTEERREVWRMKKAAQRAKKSSKRDGKKVKLDSCVIQPTGGLAARLTPEQEEESMARVSLEQESNHRERLANPQEGG